MPRPVDPPGNATIADRLDEVADLLESQGANPFRVQAWRGGASAVRHSTQPMIDLVEAGGTDALVALPAIGPGLARAIRELVDTGRLSTLDQLHGRHDPLALLASVPGIGHRLAQRLHDALGVSSLEDLERAAHHGRLEALPGFGPRRIAGIRNALAARQRHPRRREGDEPSVNELLDIDREYRASARSGTLPTIAPRRFNPHHERWLPVLHTMRQDRHYTALFSNTARAHQLGRTSDWVVIYLDGRDGGRQWTVVTETEGPLRGRRVVRGREGECQAAAAVGAG